VGLAPNNFVQLGGFNLVGLMGALKFRALLTPLPLVFKIKVTKLKQQQVN